MSTKPQATFTPRGLTRFSKLVVPDQYQEGSPFQYKTGLILDPKREDVQALLACLEATHIAGVEAVKAEAQKAIDEAVNGAAKKKAQAAFDKITVADYVHDLEDRETGESTGLVYLNFKSYADAKDGTRKHLRFFDGRNKAFSPSEEFWGGSTLRINFTPVVSIFAATKVVYTGLWINAVQVLETTNGGGGGNPEDLFGGDTSDFEAPVAPSFESPSGSGGDQVADEPTDGDY